MLDKSDKTHNVSHMPISTMTFEKDDSIRCPNCGRECLKAWTRTPAGESFNFDHWAGQTHLRCIRCSAALWDYQTNKPMYMVRNGEVIGRMVEDE